MPKQTGVFAICFQRFHNLLGALIAGSLIEIMIDRGLQSHVVVAHVRVFAKARPSTFDAVQCPTPLIDMSLL